MGLIKVPACLSKLNKVAEFAEEKQQSVLGNLITALFLLDFCYEKYTSKRFIFMFKLFLIKLLFHSLYPGCTLDLFTLTTLV